MLQAIGYLSVAFFFFSSAYGLFLQYRSKGMRYINNFPAKRILPFYVTCLITAAVYSVYSVSFGNTIKIQSIVKTMTFGGTIIMNGWYLQTLLFLYMAFYVSMKIGRNKWVQIALLVSFIAAYCVICKFTVNGTTQFESLLAFIIGIFWLERKGKLDEFLAKNKRYWLFLILSGILFGVLLILGNTSIVCENLRIIIKMCSAAVFVVVVLLIVMKVRINNRVTRVIGKYYLEIYVMQGIGLSFFHSDIAYINNPYLYILAVIATTVVLAMIIHPIYVFVNKKIKTIEWSKFNENTN